MDPESKNVDSDHFGHQSQRTLQVDRQKKAHNPFIAMAMDVLPDSSVNFGDDHSLDKFDVNWGNSRFCWRKAPAMIWQHCSACMTGAVFLCQAQFSINQFLLVFDDLFEYKPTTSRHMLLH